MTTLPRVLLRDPLQYDKDIIILQNMSKLEIHFHLTSVDQEGVVHTRLMSKLHQHPTVGFSMSCRRFSNKISQLENNFNAALSTYNCETGDEYEIQALVVPQDTDSYRQATWVDYFLPIGYNDADDTSRVMLQVNVTKAVYVNVKEFWAQLKLSLESEHSIHSDK
ncbi:MAG: hypothetical protein EZS28_036076 [Streblomastix strix]|uniref:Uncharacterized protein n=1 Tax=Streblomastix strix TaxID=222440 RepID=A0A5J4UE17_9EUKA|nr:MAG: hypothetical protein EZS28_036076 [Streblomastix strix]